MQPDAPAPLSDAARDDVLTVEEVPRPQPEPRVTADPRTIPVTRAWCACKAYHECYRKDVTECYEDADGPDGLCSGCRARS